MVSWAIICSLLSLILLIIALFMRYQTRINREKSSMYECGFTPFSETYFQFNVQFYIVAILFLLFDIEILFLYPFAISFTEIVSSFFLVFFGILFIFLLFEINSSSIVPLKKVSV